MGITDTEIALPIPEEFSDALAERVAERVIERIGESLPPRSNCWMRTREAAEYVGLTRSALYGRIADIPHHKIDRLLLFKRDDLDEWLERHRHEPSQARSTWEVPQHARQAPRRRLSPKPDSLPIGPKSKQPDKRPRRERPLPPPLGGTEEHKENWARELEISRAELYAMSPKDFTTAWDRRNQRLQDGGVFERLGDLYDTLGSKAVDRLTPTELIQAVKDLPASDGGGQ